MLRHIPQADFVEGRWRNGQGVSWEIASRKEVGAADFLWRFAKARIEHDVPFSIYPGMDRIFMMLEGGGMDLEFEGGEVLKVHEKFVPHEFSSDIPLFCRLLGGPSTDLNLFAARDCVKIKSEVISVHSRRELHLTSRTTVFFVLEGECALNSHAEVVSLKPGDAAFAFEEEQVICASLNSKLFMGHLHEF